MKSISKAEVSLHMAQKTGRGVKIGGEHGGGTEKQGFGVAKRLANPTAGRIMAQTTCTSQFNPVNNRSNGKSRINAYT